MLDSSSSYTRTGYKKWFTGAVLILVTLLLVCLSLAVAPTDVEKLGLLCAERVQQADLDRDGQSECYILKGLRLTVTEGGRTIWESPRGWQVTQFVLADSNNDGIADLNMVVWKRGSFGNYRPFWFQGEDTEYCNHLFVFDLFQGRLKPVWMSSKLDAPIAGLNIGDIDGDGRNELLVSERYSGSTTATAGVRGAGSPATGGTSYWRWDVWGFTRVALPDG